MDEHKVENIGINGHGDAVIRVRVARGALIEASTNTVSFARLAAAGLPVVNDHQKPQRRSL